VRALYVVETPEMDFGPGAVIEGNAACSVELLFALREERSGRVTISLRAKHCEPPLSMVSFAIRRNTEPAPLTAGWIEVSGERVMSSLAPIEALFGAVSTQITDELAIELLERIAKGSMPSIGFGFPAGADARQVQIINSVDPVRASGIRAALEIWRQRRS